MKSIYVKLAHALYGATAKPITVGWPIFVQLGRALPRAERLAIVFVESYTELPQLPIFLWSRSQSAVL